MTVDGNLALYWTRQGAPIQERLIIGSLYFFSALIFLILQLSVIFVFCFYKDLRNHLCYRIMLFISIADSIQLVVHAYGGIICIIDNSFSFYLEKIAGGLANSLSLLNWPICLVLAINRLLVFLPAKLSERKEEILFNWLIALSLLQGLPFFVLYLTPHATLGFRYYNWDYLKLDMFEYANWDWVERTTETLPLPYVVITFIVYLSIFCILMDQVRKIIVRYKVCKQGCKLITICNSL
ncbi:unnamed protein product [Meloidogyne enterolobii]|uniref:Uncharacterized protein n=1 Tax=Meloidogyne enterolobii TaxID=390850 RepID=A0ACB1A8N7_MELEN